MKTLSATLHFSDHHVVGTLVIDGERFEIAGTRLEKKPAKRQPTGITQLDMFEDDHEHRRERPQ
ncbi:MAG TPA: hypothetical protein VK660_07230 [Xanthomonadaceae bacterium]|jgi:hypothetical protein|nr:hypothetical protein [Xanthomonadaceae bacterium]